MATIEEKCKAAKQYLNVTDWMAIREADGGEIVPPRVRDRRSECRLYLSNNDVNTARVETLALMETAFYTTDTIDIALDNLATAMGTRVAARNSEIEAEYEASQIALAAEFATV